MDEAAPLTDDKALVRAAYREALAAHVSAFAVGLTLYFLAVSVASLALLSRGAALAAVTVFVASLLSLVVTLGMASVYLRRRAARDLEAENSVWHRAYVKRLLKEVKEELS